MFPPLRSSDRSTFYKQEGAQEVHEVLPGFFENFGFDRFLVFRTDDNRKKVSDLCVCVFDIFDGIIGCC